MHKVRTTHHIKRLPWIGGFMHNKGVVTAFMLLMAGSQVQAQESAMTLRLGQEFKHSGFDSQTVDIKWQQSVWQWGDSPCGLALGLRAGAMEVESDRAIRVGGGGSAYCQWENWRVWIPLDAIWLSKYRFSHNHDHLDYGGHIQFTSGLGVGYRFADRWLVGYQYEHMSNSNLYDANPGGEFHTLLVSYFF